MAKELAKQIYLLAENDGTWNAGDLKESLNRSHDSDYKKWRKMLKSAIKIQIDNSNAMTMNEYDLYVEKFPVSKINNYTQSKFRRRGKYTRKKQNYNIGQWLTVTDENMKRFLDEVVYQLDLDWYPIYSMGEMTIVVTWGHWINK